MKVPSIIKLVFNRHFFQKIFAVGLLVFIAYELRQFAFLFLTTFLLSYLFLALWWFLSEKLNKYVVQKIKHKKFNSLIWFLFKTNSIVLFLYLLFIWLIIFAISDLLPKVIKELSDIPKYMPFLSTQISDLQSKLEEIKNFKQDIKWTFETLMTESNYDILLKFLWNLKTVWIMIIEFIIALILSFVFIIDRKKIKEYLEDVKKGNFAFLYNEYAVFFWKISNWFWLIFKAQSIISIVNTILTILGLYFIWYINNIDFQYIFTLAIIVFIFWMIPVLGMFISSVPIIMIWFSVGWVPIVIECTILILIIHMIESYYLNPRIVSSYAEFPISMTFLILVISEQFFWFAWLLVWVPVFYIFIDFMKDFDNYIGKVKKAYSWISFLQKETKKSISSDIRLSRSGKKSI